MVKKHLVIDSRMIEHSGIGVYLKNIIPYLSTNFSITLLGNHLVLEKFGFTQDKGFTIVEANIAIYSLKEQWVLPFLIPSCDIYWSPHFNIPLLPIKAVHKFLTICDAFHWAHYQDLSISQKIYTKVIGFFVRNKWAKKIFTLSEFSKSELTKYLQLVEDDIKIVGCAVDDAFNSNYTYHKITDEYLLFVGNVKPHKNLLNALIAFDAIKDIYPRYKFYIVGKKDGFITGSIDELSSFIEKLGDRIFFTGYVQDRELKNYYANASLFIFPSKYEGFGLPPLEAMKFNIPIVCSDAASLPEVCGDAVLYFDPYNTEDIAKKVSIVIENLWTMDITKYKKQIEKFNWKLVADVHLEQFNNIK
jgi:glycosyltransferase involved in cell wall biosynthesis